MNAKERGEGIRFNQEFEIAESEPRVMYPVDAIRWDRMIERIERSEDNVPFYHSGAWTLVGVAASAFFAAFLLPDRVQETTPYVHVICWSIFFLSAVLAIALLFFARTNKHDRRELRAQVVEDMKDIRREFSRPVPDHQDA